MSMSRNLHEGLVSHQGIVRSHNEDSYGSFHSVLPEPDKRATALLERKGRLYVVADGMGGHEGGEVASALAVQAICTAYYADPNDDPTTALRQAITRANTAIHTAAQLRQAASTRLMGTTVVCAIIKAGRLTVGHVGDSRAYRLRNGQLTRLTEDHDWVTAQMRTQGWGRAEAEERARQRGARGVLLRALGTQALVEPDIMQLDWQTGDTLLLCSDGLHGLIGDQDIAAALTSQPAALAAQMLVNAANAAGGHDNVTALVIGDAPAPAPVRRWGSRLLTSAILLLALLFVVFGMTLPVANGQPLFSANSMRAFAGLPTLQPTVGLLPTATPLPTATATPTPTATTQPSPLPTRVPPTAKPTARPATPTHAPKPTPPATATNIALPTATKDVPQDATALPAPPDPVAPSAAPLVPTIDPAAVAAPSLTPTAPTELQPTSSADDPGRPKSKPAPTGAPEPPTSAPEPPTSAPEPPTSAPEPPTSAPEPPTSAPEPPTSAPEPPTSAPEPTRVLPPKPTIGPSQPQGAPA